MATTYEYRVIATGHDGTDGVLCELGETTEAEAVAEVTGRNDRLSKLPESVRYFSDCRLERRPVAGWEPLS